MYALTGGDQPGLQQLLGLLKKQLEARHLGCRCAPNHGPFLGCGKDYQTCHLRWKIIDLFTLLH